MTPTVTLTISNINNSDYPTIILRKFFNMVFVEEDGKTLNIYTATVFGGAEHNNGNDKPIPKVVNGHACALKFAYDIQGGQSSKNRNDTVRIKFSDDTAVFLDKKKHNGNLTNWGQIMEVWGEIEELGQDRAGLTLHEFYPNLFPDKKNLPKPDVTKGVHLRCEEKKKKDSHRFVASPGKFEIGNDSKSYSLKNEHDVVGVEAINWVKTTIELNCDILKPRIMADRKINFDIKFENDCKYYTPDFTWYFAPPPSYVVDDSALVDVADKENIENIVTPVADKDTVRFDKWIDERILERKKSRVLMKNYVDADPYVLSGQCVRVNLSFSNPGRHSNTQFFIGLIVAFFLSFCADKTRLNDFLEICTQSICACDEPCQCNLFVNSLGIWFPALVIIVFFSLTYTRKRCFPGIRWYEWIICSFKWVGLSVALVLMAYIYYGWLVHPEILSKFVTTCAENRRWISSLLGISIICNLVYVGYCSLAKKKNVVDFF